MEIRCGFKIDYFCERPAPFVLMLNVRPERQRDLITPEVLTVSPSTPVHHYRDIYDNVCSRVLAPEGEVSFTADFRIRDTGEPDMITPDAIQHPIAELPDEALVFLLASRYCETELLSQEAWDLFGGVEPGWARVQAIVDYAHKRITFGYPHARSTRTAHEAHQEQHGVCRDFAHLAVTLCRCMNIPARYCTGYLGDIGIDIAPAPMDFSAWFQVWLGGAWHTFDARHNRPRIGRILMAVGRDAADVAITTTFGSTRLTGFEVVTDEIVEG